LNARRRFAIALVGSIAIHALIFSIQLKKKLEDTVLGSAPPQPMTVTILEKAIPQVQESPPPTPKPAPTAPPPPPIIASRRPQPKAPAVPVPPPTPPPPSPEPPRPEPRPAPAMDMSAMIEARRAQRRAAEAAVRANREPSPEELAQAAIARNLNFEQRQGVGGVFQILRKSTRTAEFAFNGWRPNSERQWREVIEVDAGQGGDIDRAIVKRMIELIRTHYKGDFRWDSHRLGRVVVLSARIEDNEGLEEFLIREFFGTPTIGPGGR
jgi:outer membrane biosynthesis protein TonB